MKLFLAIIALLGCLVYAGVLTFGIAPILLTDRDRDVMVVSQEALAKINEYRSQAGINSLVWDDELAELALSHSQAMDESGRFYHSAHPYNENILEGGFYSTGEPIAELWKESPAHYRVMMSQYIDSGAVGISGSYATFMAR